MVQYYLGKISKIIDRVTYEIRVDIDGIVEEKPAFPLRGEVSEPKIGDYVLLRNIDPLYGSMYLYSKLKEDRFIGFRSNGKALEITPEYIEITVYELGGLEDAHDGFEDVGQSPWFTRIKCLANGNVIISVGKGKEGNLTINTYGDTKILTKGDTEIACDGDMTLDAPKITLKDLQSIPGTSGALNCIPVCPLTGAPHYLDFGINPTHMPVKLDATDT